MALILPQSWYRADAALSPAVATGPVAIVYESTNSTDSGAATYTYTAQGIGTAASDRVVVVGIWGRDAGTTADISSVTIGGSAATQIVKARVNPVNTNIAAIYALLVTTGTTADIVLNFNETMVRAGIIVWKMTGHGGVATADFTATDVTSSDPLSTTIDVPANGAAVAIAVNGSGSSNTTTWTGLTEAIDSVIGTNTMTGANADFVAAQTGLSVQADWSADESESVLAVASWG